MRIRLGQYEATVENRRWKCANDALEQMLNAHVQANPPQQYTPNVEEFLAREAARRFGGELVASPEPVAVPVAAG